MAESKPEKKIEKVVTGPVTTKKPSPIRKVADSMIADDAKNVGNYILFDVVIPAIKDTISSVVSNGVDMLLFGEGGRTRSKSTVSSIFGTMNYNSISTSKAKGQAIKPIVSSNSYDRYQIDDLVFDTRAQCQEVIYHMQDVLQDYGMISIADLYDMVGLQSNFTDNKYGWDDLSGAEPVRMRNGQYVLKLPRVRTLD